MLISKEKVEDIELRLKYLSLVVTSLKFYAITGDKSFYDFSAFFGKQSRELKEVIDRDDYSEREKRRNEFDKNLIFNI